MIRVFNLILIKFNFKLILLFIIIIILNIYYIPRGCKFNLSNYILLF